ncbi:DUF5666 domain-containing protein [Alicycliphilus sp. T452]|jgi:hypothetical protein
MMMTFHRSLPLRLGTLALAAAAAACGGGGGGADAPAAPASLSYATGAIHGFGSIRVNGVRYDDSAARVLDDAGAASRAGDLRLGMVVELQSSAPQADGTGAQAASASEIRWRSEVEGPVTAVDAAAGTLTVLGQSVGTTPGTVFDDGLRGGLSRLAVGQVVEVHGFADAQGAIVATRIEREEPGRRYKLRGSVQSVDTAARTLRVGALTISYANLALAAPPAQGATVRLELAPMPDAAGRWVATRIDGIAASTVLPAGGAFAEVEGIVTAYASAARFSVNGVAVDASAVASVPAGVRLGARVEVEGTLKDGVLAARRVALDGGRGAGDGLEIEGRVERIDAAARQVVVRGVTVDYSAASWRGGTAAQLVVGAKVEIEGTLSANGSTLQASKVEFDD